MLTKPNEAEQVLREEIQVRLQRRNELQAAWNENETRLAKIGPLVADDPPAAVDAKPSHVEHPSRGPDMLLSDESPKE